jgi:hypothetical protein
MLVGAVSATGGARPTGLELLDPIILGLGGVAVASCGVRSRTLPLYVAAGLAAALQPSTVPLALGVLGLAVALARRWRPRLPALGAIAGGLTWAAAVGVPGERAATAVLVPVAALGWVACSARRNGRRRFRERFDRVGIGLSGVLLVCAGLGAVAAVSARSHVDRGTTLLRSGLDAARVGDTAAAIEHLRAAGRALGRGESSLGAVWARAAWVIPGISQNARSLHDAVTEVGVLARTAVVAAEEADLASLGARRGQIDLAAVAATEAPLSDVLDQLHRSRRAIARLEDRFLVPPVASRIDDLQAQLDDAIPSAELALDGVQAAPSLLGGDGPRTYLVLFTTPVEARARTGFPGNFAEVTFVDGRFDMTRFGRVSELNEALPDGGGEIDPPEDYLRRYGRFGPHQEWRNITLAPDFPAVAGVAAGLYPQSGGREVDGVMSVDPVALAALLRFTGPIAVPGLALPLTHENADEFLLRDQYVELPDVPERIDALETLAELAFDRLQAVDLPGPRELGHVLGPVVERGHLQVVTFDEASGAFLDELGITGRYPDVVGDFVGVTTSNAGASKIDLFLERTLGYEVEWDPSTGTLLATATITLTNSAPADGLPRYVIGNALGVRLGEEELPDGWNHTFLTLYTPWDLTGATLDREPLALERIDELGRRALSTFVSIPPGGTRTLVVELEGVLAGPDYRLDLGAQPLVEPEVADVEIRVAGGGDLRERGPLDASEGRVAGRFSLTRDTVIAIDR